MNLNDFVVLPKSTASSVKLNARNPQELQMKMATLAQESSEMEEKLQWLKESMRKEKEERGPSGGFRWQSGQSGSLNSGALINNAKRIKEIRLQKLSAGKVKIRVLKDEPATAPSQAMPPPPTIDLRKTRQSRLRGPFCGNCEVETAGAMCAECTEDYCSDCLFKFHQKGALKRHQTIPFQTDLQTRVSTRGAVGSFQREMIPDSSPSAFKRLGTKPSPNVTIKPNANNRQGDQSLRKTTEAGAKLMQECPDPSQVLAVTNGEENRVEMKDEKGFPTSLLLGEYDEEESGRSFQDALRQWRGDKNEGDGQQIAVSVSATATQADPVDRKDEGRRDGNGRFPVRVEFSESSLKYVDRLLLKKYRRTLIEMYHSPLASGACSNSPPDTNHEEETASHLTAQEEDFRRYCASLFAVPAVSRGSTEAQIASPESYLTIEILDETDGDTVGDRVAEQRTEDDKKVPTVQMVLNEEGTAVPQTTLTGGGPSGVTSSSSTPVQSSGAPTRSKALQKLSLSQPQDLQVEAPIKTGPCDSKPSPSPTTEAPRTPKTSITTATSKSQKPNRSPTVHKSEPQCGSSHRLSSPSLLHSQTEDPKSSHAPVSRPSDVSPSARARAPITDEHLVSSPPSTSFSLRSTFTVSPAGSAESLLLPRVYPSTQVQEHSDSSLLPEQPRLSQLFPEPILSLKLSRSPSPRSDPLRQSQPSPSGQESPIPVNQPQRLLSSASSSRDPSPKPPPVETLSGSSVLNESPSDQYSRHRSTPTNEGAPDFMLPPPSSGDHESTLSPHAAPCIPSLPSHLLGAIRNPLAVQMGERDELSTDSEEEMFSDSLGMTPPEEDSSEEEAQIHSPASRRWSREGGQTNPAVREERGKDLQTDVQEQLPEASMVMNKQNAGPGSDQFRGLHGFLPPGSSMNTGNVDTSRCDSQAPADDSDPTELEDDWPRGSITTRTDEHLPFAMMTDNHMQPPGIPILPTARTWRGETPAKEPGAFGRRLSAKSSPTLAQVPAGSCLSYPTPGTELGPAWRPSSRAVQEIMEICDVDQVGCEDPDLDSDATAHALHELEQELRLMTAETWKDTSVFGVLSSISPDQDENLHFKRGKINKDLEDEEAAAAQRDRQSVLSLP